jgi:hypothetical protein
LAEPRLKKRSEAGHRVLATALVDSHIRAIRNIFPILLADLARACVQFRSTLPTKHRNASADAADKVRRLGVGADDSVTIAFSPRELISHLGVHRHMSCFPQNR